MDKFRITEKSKNVKRELETNMSKYNKAQEKIENIRKRPQYRALCHVLRPFIIGWSP